MHRYAEECALYVHPDELLCMLMTFQEDNLIYYPVQEGL
jgi:hypothetical protein